MYYSIFVINTTILVMKLLEVCSMFMYENKLPLDVSIDRPDPILYEMLDHERKGCARGLHQAMVYIRQSFMIHNQSFQDLFLRLGASRITDMEILSGLLHQLHGVDDRYYDESNDDTPAFEFIKPCDDVDHGDIQEEHHVNNDLTACVMRDIQFEEQQQDMYEKLIEKTQDQGARHVLNYLKKNCEKSMDVLKNLLTILTTHTEMKDFGEGDTHNAWDYDTSNYFDKPNPYFLNPDDKEH